MKAKHCDLIVAVKGMKRDNSSSLVYCQYMMYIGLLSCGEMLDAIEERMKQDDETTATQLMKMLGEQDLDAHGQESQEDTGINFDIALVPDKNLLHDPLRSCNRAQL